MFRIICLLLTVSLLTACVTPMKLGISQAEWENYTPEQRQKIKDGYYKNLRTRIQAQDMSPDGSNLHVQVSGGEASLPPFSQACAYQPLEFNLANGSCEKIMVTNQEGADTATLRACFYGKTLYLDPSRYDPEKKIGSIQLHYSPIWDRGFTYQGVTSTGYIHLNKVNVTVKRYDGHESCDNTD